MIAVIFEVWPADGQQSEYLHIAASLPRRPAFNRRLYFGRAFSKSDELKQAVVLVVLAR